MNVISNHKKSITDAESFKNDRPNILKDLKNLYIKKYESLSKEIQALIPEFLSEVKVVNNNLMIYFRNSQGQKVFEVKICTKDIHDFSINLLSFTKVISSNPEDLQTALSLSKITTYLQEHGSFLKQDFMEFYKPFQEQISKNMFLESQSLSNSKKMERQISKVLKKTILTTAIKDKSLFMMDMCRVKAIETNGQILLTGETKYGVQREETISHGKLDALCLELTRSNLEAVMKEVASEVFKDELKNKIEGL